MAERPSVTQLGDDLADDRPELEAMAREAEGMDEVRRRRREADHRDVVGHLAVDAGPGADHDGCRPAPGRVSSALAMRRATSPSPGASGCSSASPQPPPPPRIDVAARDLAQVDAAAADADRAADEERQRLGDEHVRHQRRAAARPRRTSARPRPAPTPAQLTRKRLCHLEIVGAGLEAGRRRASATITAACSRTSAPSRRARRANAGPTRRGLACPSSAQSEAPTTSVAEPGRSRPQRARAEQLRRSPCSAASLRIALELRPCRPRSGRA